MARAVCARPRGMPASGACHIVAAAVLASAWWIPGAESSYAHPKRWVIVSQPTQGTISYASLPRGGYLRSSVTNVTMNTLITGFGSKSEPMGLAVDQDRDRLFVADPVGKQILAYTLHYSRDPTYLSVGAPYVWASNVEARWVAVDGSGDIFFSDEAANQILTVPLANGMAGDRTPVVLYDGSSVAQVSAPGGVAADGVMVYWVNKKLGTKQGTLVAAPKAPSKTAGEGIRLLATNADKSYGVCLVTKNAFYTQPDHSIYGVELVTRSSESPATAITNRLSSPRGCAFDGDGTVYVADRSANALYSFAGNQQVLGFAAVARSVDLADAFDVAVFSRARPTSPCAVASAVLSAVAAFFSFSLFA